MSMSVALGKPTVDAEELEAVSKVFDSGWLSGGGPACREFEQAFAAAVGVNAALATANCGTALHLALVVLGVRPDDEVIVADYTFPATGHAVAWTGARPVFADVRPDIWTIDPQCVEPLITERTVGIVAVDAFGQPADYDELRTIAQRHGLWIIEDAACAAGATYKGRPAGSLADVGAFSFHGRKGITAGEGGALVSDQAELVEHARKLHTYGIAPAIDREGSGRLPVPTFTELGFNYRLSDVAAAIMQVQLKKMPTLLGARAHVAAGYRQLLGDVAELTLPTELPDRTHPWQSYVVTVAPEVSRDAVAIGLRSRGVGCNFGTYSSHLQPVYGVTNPCPVSADLFGRHLAIPMHASLTDEEVEYVADVLRDVVRNPACRQ